MLRQSLLVVAVCVVAVGFALARGANLTDAVALLQMIGAIVAVAAGVACIVRWRILGSAFTGWFGAGLVTFGVLRMTETGLSMFPNGAFALGGPAGRLLVYATVGTITYRAVSSPEVDSGLNPLRVLSWATVLGLVALGTVSLLLAHGGIDPILTQTGQYLDVAAALYWSVLVVLTFRGRRRVRTVPWWAYVVPAGLAVSSALRAAGPGQAAWGFAAATFVVLTVSVAATGGISHLEMALLSQDRYARGLRSEVEHLDEKIHRERVELEVRLHDLRNAVAAVRGADSTLRRYADKLDDVARLRLSEAITSELERLQILIEPGRPAAAVDFELSKVLQPVLAVEATMGTPIEADLGQTRVNGDPDGLAQVLQNLLSNSRRYAPGTTVRIDDTHAASTVELWMRDGGPGIPEAERSAVFSRGLRGSSAAGTDGQGLGLSVADQLMAAMGGSIHLVDAESGACFVLRLRAAGSTSRETSRPNLRRVS